MERTEAVASALGSTRAEGLEPDAETIGVLDAWARGELSDDDLETMKRRAVGGESILPAQV